MSSPGRRPPTRQSSTFPRSFFPAQVTGAHTNTHETRVHRQGHTRTRGHTGTRRDQGTSASVNAQTRVQGHPYTLAHRRADRGTRAHTSTRAHQPKSASTPRASILSQLPVPCAPGSRFPAPLPLAERPLTWRRCRRARAPRAHPPGGPGVRARSRMAVRVPAEGRAGPGEESRGRRGPLPGGDARQVCLLGPCVWESQEKLDPGSSEMKRSPIPSPLGRQESDAANKSQANERTAPRRPSI